MATEPGGPADLVGGGASKVGVSGALRARDVSRPEPAQLEEAERTVRVSRRAPEAREPVRKPAPAPLPRPVPGPPAQLGNQEGSSGGAPDRS